MIEKILNGEYVAKLIKKRLCDVVIWVANQGKNYYKPFIDLINHWMAKGYTPVMIEE